MNSYRLMHLPSGREIAVVTKADSWWAKGWGVLGRSEMPAGQGLWLPGVASVHTVGVRFPLDLLFLDKDLQTIKAVDSVMPGRLLVRVAGAAHTLELGGGTLTAEPETGSAWRLEPLPLERLAPEKC